MINRSLDRSRFNVASDCLNTIEMSDFIYYNHCLILYYTNKYICILRLWIKYCVCCLGFFQALGIWRDSGFRIHESSMNFVYNLFVGGYRTYTRRIRHILVKYWCYRIDSLVLFLRCKSMADGILI
jgi:hypothetical protein